MMLQRTLLLAATALLLAAPAHPQQTERDVFNTAAGETDPVKKLTLLTSWTERFPVSVFSRERNLHYLSCYSQLEAAAVAPGAAPEKLTLGERAATVMITRTDELFATAMRPETVTGANWAAARTEALRQAHSVLAALASNRKDFARAESEYRALLT